MAVGMQLPTSPDGGWGRFGEKLPFFPSHLCKFFGGMWVVEEEFGGGLQIGPSVSPPERKASRYYSEFLGCMIAS